MAGRRKKRLGGGWLVLALIAIALLRFSGGSHQDKQNVYTRAGGAAAACADRTAAPTAYALRSAAATPRPAAAASQPKATATAKPTAAPQTKATATPKPKTAAAAAKPRPSATPAPRFVGTNASGGSSAVTRSAARQTAPPAKKSAAAQGMRVSVSASCGNYNHVGNNWSQDYYINGKSVRSGASVSLKAGDKITVKARITEDDKYPDVGTGEASHTVTEKDLKNGFSIRLTVTVRENKGRYSGSACTWSVTFSFR